MTDSLRWRQNINTSFEERLNVLMSCSLLRICRYSSAGRSAGPSEAGCHSGVGFALAARRARAIHGRSPSLRRLQNSDSSFGEQPHEMNEEVFKGCSLLRVCRNSSAGRSDGSFESGCRLGLGLAFPGMRTRAIHGRSPFLRRLQNIDSSLEEQPHEAMI